LNRQDFLDNGLWTPQTVMMRQIQDWLIEYDGRVEKALSIDSNPALDALLLSKWPDISIERTHFPAVDVTNLAMYAPGSFDLVYSHQVLEHVAKPWIAAHEIERVLKAGGIGIHTSCAFNPRHGQPHFNDYYRFLKDGLEQLFDNAVILQCDEWGNREAIQHNVAVDDGFGDLGGRRFPESIGAKRDTLYPWVTWIIFQKPMSKDTDHSSETGRATWLDEVPVILEDSHGIKFVLRGYERPFRERLTDRSCDDAVFAAYSALVAPGDIVFDVGSHIGRYSVYPSRIVGPTGKVYSFEPVEENYWQLKVTLALNKCENILTFNNAICDAVTDTEINIFSEEFSSWASLGKPQMIAPDGSLQEPRRTQKVHCETLDHFCSTNKVEKINFLKIDVEGYELAALRGAESMLSHNRIDYICFEISEQPLKAAGVRAEQIVEYLNKFGYAIYAIDGPPLTWSGPIGDVSCFHDNFIASYKPLMKS
jgi:FkbM family methyltransferase